MAQINFIDWLQAHLLTCPFKWLTGFDCPGCGFQRAVLALLQSNLKQSFDLYPPAIPLVLVFFYIIADSVFKLDTAKGNVKKVAFITAGIIVLTSYTIKMAR